MKATKTLLWFVLGGGIFIFLEYLVSSLILLPLIVLRIPIGKQTIRHVGPVISPFEREIVRTNLDKSPPSVLKNILKILIWLFPSGLIIILTHLILAFLTAITWLGIPFAKQHLNLIKLAFSPFNNELIKTPDRKAERKRGALAFIKRFKERAYQICDQIDRVDQFLEAISDVSSDIKRFVNSSEYSDLIPAAERNRILEVLDHLESLHRGIEPAADICDQLQEALEIADLAVRSSNEVRGSAHTERTASPASNPGFWGKLIRFVVVVSIVGALGYFLYDYIEYVLPTEPSTPRTPIPKIKIPELDILDIVIPSVD